MRHVRAVDEDEQTVIMVQVENESGSLGTVRDFSPAATKLFAGSVPKEIVTALHEHTGTWQEFFGKDADEAFAAYGVAHYVNQVASVGKAEYALPIYCNNWLRSPYGAPRPGADYPSGGPTYNMLDIWKAAAPAIDMIGPDNYQSNPAIYREVLRAFHRTDNPMWVPETLGFGHAGAVDSSLYLFYALGQDAIGFSPFGFDSVPENAFAKEISPELAGQVANYRLLGSMDRELAELLYEGKVKVAVEEPVVGRVVLNFGKWNAIVSFPPHYWENVGPGASRKQDGRVLVASIGQDEFLVAGFDARVDFVLAQPALHEHVQYLRVEEGDYSSGAWKTTRWLNGDETDYGMNFYDDGAILHAKVGTY
jgi:beta-galactosidase GanA